MTPIETVEMFIDAWNRMAWGRVTEMVSADCVYHNIPMQPVTGPEGVRSVIESLGDIKGVDWEILNIAENGNVVLTERIDRFAMGSGAHIEIPVMGTFEVEEGEITAWRDYFDLGQLTAQMQAG
ncbi:MAG: limonene-1,2-epoxide hydrolase family protein [Pseudomonadota bacterium]